MTPEELIRRGEAAQRLLSEPLLKEAFETIRQEVVKTWAETPARDAEGREWVWRHYKVIERAEALLRGYIETGRFESAKLIQKEKPVDKIANLFRR